jgi:hypothetical protein
MRPVVKAKVLSQADIALSMVGFSSLPNIARESVINFQPAYLGFFHPQSPQAL